MSFTKDSLGFKDDYFYYHASYIGGRFDSPELRSFKGVYHVKDMSYLSLATNTYGSLLSVCICGEVDRHDVSVRTFYLDDYKYNTAYYKTLVHNVNNRIKYYSENKEKSSNLFVCKFFAIGLIAFILLMVYLCGIS